MNTLPKAVKDNSKIYDSVPAPKDWKRTKGKIPAYEDCRGTNTQDSDEFEHDYEEVSENFRKTL